MSRFLGGGGQGFCDNSTVALVIKHVTMGVGVKNCPKLRHIIYGRPQRQEGLDQLSCRGTHFGTLKPKF